MAKEAAIAFEIGRRNEAVELKLMGRGDIRLMEILKKAEAVEAYAFHLEELRSTCMPRLVIFRCGSFVLNKSSERSTNRILVRDLARQMRWMPRHFCLAELLLSAQRT